MGGGGGIINAPALISTAVTSEMFEPKVYGYTSMIIISCMKRNFYLPPKSVRLLKERMCVYRREFFLSFKKSKEIDNDLKIDLKGKRQTHTHKFTKFHQRHAR